MSSVIGMRFRVVVVACLGCIFLIGGPMIATAATTTTVPASTMAPPLQSTTSTSTSSTTLPSAVTTVPEGCDAPSTALAVFIGSVRTLSDTTAVYDVKQIRAGSLEGYVSEGTVEVRYGRDAKFLEEATTYIVGVIPDPVTLRLSSSIHDAAKLFGGADVAGANTVCPVFEEAARTLHIDGTAIDSGIFSQLFESPWRIIAALLIGPACVFLLLFAAVKVRQGVKN